MTREEAKQRYPLLQAHAEGKVIQVLTAEGWQDTHDPCFLAPVSHYRIKPEPLECWVNVYENNFTHSHASAENARSGASGMALRTAVHCREVIE